MDRMTLKALYVILISLGLALVFNFLFFDQLLGVSVFIFVAALVGSVFLFGLYHQISLRKSWWMILLIGFFALMPGVRANGFLTFLNICATFGLLLLLAHQLNGTPAFVLKLWDYLTLVVVVPVRMLARVLPVVSLAGQIHSTVQNRDVWIRILKGVVMAVPVLILFGILFSQADLAFSQFVTGFVYFDISDDTIHYTVLLVFAFVATLGFLSYIFFPNQTQPAALPQQALAPSQSGRQIEVMVFLGLIAALFLVFIGFQITYLFGGEANIINAGFTYAEYARHGFWELLAVAALSLVILLTSDKYASNESKTTKQFLVPSLILIAEVVIVMVSAFKRLSLYIDTYGMTLLRFYVAGFIMLLLVLFILLAVKFIKSKKEQFFAFGSLLSIAGFIMVVNIVNPDVFIARANMEHYNRTGKIDIAYVYDLSSDAEAWKIELYHKLQGEDKKIVGELLQGDKIDLEQSSGHWQSANLSRARALKLLNNLGQ